MAGKTPSEADVANTLSGLQLSTNQKSVSKPKSKPVADSWDDELSSGSDTETETLSKTNTKDSLSPINTISSSTSDAANGPNPPPPTPASPHPFEFPDNVPFSQRHTNLSREGSRGGNGTATSDKRPEKTTAVASRIIAAGLGIRAPRRTEEEREYDKAMKEKAKKQREEERGREKREAEAAEARKKAVWED